MNFYPIYRNKKLLPWIKWWLIKGNKVTPKHLSEWINSAEAITLTGVYKGSPLLNLNLNGNTSQTGTPTPEAPVPVNVVKGNNTIKINDTDYQVNLKSKNLLNENDLSNKVFETNVYKNTELDIKGNRTLYFNAQLKEGKSNLSGLYLAIATTKNPNNGIAIFSIKNGVIQTTSLSENLPTETIYISYYPTTYTIEQILDTYNLWISTSATTYEPYYDYELCKIGDYQDVIYKENNKYYVEKKVGKVVLNGTETGWKNDSTNKLSGLTVSDAKSIVSPTVINALCSHYKAYSLPDSRTNTNGFSGNATDIWFNNNSMTLANFKTWVSNNNLTVYYTLETSTTTEITETNLIAQLEAIYNAKLQSGTNTITQTPSDLPFYLNFRYYEKG